MLSLKCYCGETTGGLDEVFACPACDYAVCEQCGYSTEHPCTMDPLFVEMEEAGDDDDSD